MSTASTESTERTFEEVVSRLEDVVKRLEGGELPLEESLAIFEEGVKLSREGAERLDAAEKRVEELLQGSGTARTQPWSDDDEEPETR